MTRITLQRFLLACLVAACVISPVSVSFADDEAAAVVKAAFLHKFSLFTEWPESKRITEKGVSVVNICVLGKSDVSKTKSIFDEASSDKLKFKLLQKSNAKSVAQDCHILFISSSEKASYQEQVADIGNAAVLTVSDIPGFASGGGMIELSLVNNRMKIGVINDKLASATGIKIGADLLGISNKVIKE